MDPNWKEVVRNVFISTVSTVTLSEFYYYWCHESSHANTSVCRTIVLSGRIIAAIGCPSTPPPSSMIRRFRSLVSRTPWWPLTKRTFCFAKSCPVETSQIDCLNFDSAMATQLGAFPRRFYDHSKPPDDKM